ncbi:MAG: hypothetical protein LBN36_03180 [Clostridiales Family XIII bacterium]|jgi:hypothetical protein|nr:hypothetical protein [Clostridiales Family XIII bacterium]
MSQHNDQPQTNGKRVLVGILSSVLAVFVFVFAFAAISVFIIRDVTAPDTLKTALDETDFMEVRVGTILDAPDKNVLIGKWIYTNINPEIVEASGITESKIDSILSKSTIDSFIADNVNDYVESLYSDSNVAGITNREVIKFIQKNEELVYEETGYQISERDYEKLDKFIDKKIPEALKDPPTNHVLWRTARMLSSYYVVIGALVLCLLLLALVFLANRSDKIKIPLRYGRTITVLGVALLLTGVLVMPVGKTLGAQYDVDLYFQLLPLLRGDFLIYGGLTAGVGILLICLYLILKIIHTKSVAKKQREFAASVA